MKMKGPRGPAYQAMLIASNGKRHELKTDNQIREGQKDAHRYVDGVAGKRVNMRKMLV